MKVGNLIKEGDLVRFTGGGEKLGIGIVMKLFPYTGDAEVVWNGVDLWPVRVISWKWLEVISESR